MSNELALRKQMAQAVAHDVNNVLTAVAAVGYQLERRATACDAKLGKTLRSCVQLGRDLVAQLRRFDERSQAGAHVLPLRDIIERIQPIVDILVRPVAALIVDTDLPAGATTTVPVDEVEQIILNLCLNARDAIGGGGHIRITARDGGAELFLEISDDGDGMAAEISSRVFEPSFTTRPTGTGLGLTTVRSIADTRGIGVDVVSQPGRGTTFRLGLPRATPSDAPVASLRGGWRGP